MRCRFWVTAVQRRKRIVRGAFPCMRWPVVFHGAFVDRCRSVDQMGQWSLHALSFCMALFLVAAPEPQAGDQPCLC